MMKIIPYKEVYKALQSVVDNLEKDSKSKEVFKNTVSADYYYHTLRSILKHLPKPEPECDLLSSIEEIKQAGLLEKAAWKARINIIESYQLKVDPDDSGSPWDTLENVRYLIADLMTESDEELVNDYLKIQGGFCKESREWIPF